MFNMNTLNVRVTYKTNDLIEKAREEYLKHHPEFKEMYLSNNKILYEVLIFYLK
jgi:hypothetical protein